MPEALTTLPRFDMEAPKDILSLAIEMLHPFIQHTILEGFPHFRHYARLSLQGRVRPSPQRGDKML